MTSNVSLALAAAWFTVLAGVNARKSFADDLPSRKQITKTLELLHIFVKQKGYIEAPLLRSASNSMDLLARLNGAEFLFELDSGASHTCFDLASTKAAKLSLSGKKSASSGLNGVVLQQERSLLSSFCIGANAATMEILCIDMSHINKSRESFGAPPIQGLIGNSYLNSFAAIIDYPSRKLFLHPRNVSINLNERLRARGYFESPLIKSKSGTIDLNLTIDRRPCVVILDTGSSSSVLDFSCAKRAGLELKSPRSKFAGLGVTVLSHKVAEASFEVGGANARSEVIVLDLSGINKNRAVAGDNPCDGILGDNYLECFSAIIDYSSSKLFLLDPTKIKP